MSTLQNYVLTFNLYANQHNGIQLAKHLALPLHNNENKFMHQSFVNNISNVDINSYCTNNCNDYILSGICSNRILALVAYIKQDFEAAYRYQSTMYNLTLDYFSNKSEDISWFIPVLVKVSNDLRIISQLTDEFNHDINNKYLRESLNNLTKGFTTVAKDRLGSKKLAIFAITNVLFKIYFKVNTLQLCSKLINVVEGPNSSIMKDIKQYPICDVVMYKYYIGRLKMFEDRYLEARECLRFALKYCPISCMKNRQRILVSLIPVEMCLGIMPSKYISDIYQLNEFVELGKATIQGNIGLFDQILSTYQASFVRLGVYLVLEQVKMIAYRNLFLKIYKLTNNTRLNLHIIHNILVNTMNQDSDLDEIECVLSNLIYQNKIKGYISHEKRYLIISKTDPFPISAIIK